MKTVRVRNETRQTVLGDRVQVADTFWTRLRGMLGRPEPRNGEGLLLLPSQSVHMWWMKYPLDVAMLDVDRKVLACYQPLEPGQRSRWHRKARFALELPAGQLQQTQTQTGDRISWTPTG